MKDETKTLDPESVAYREWRAAAIELEAAERARVDAARRFQEALAKLARVVAPPSGPAAAKLPSS